MEDYIKEALEIVKAQASVRTMTEEEITSMVQKLSTGIRNISEGVKVEALDPSANAKKAIKEKSISCLECGKIFKVITKKLLGNKGNRTPASFHKELGRLMWDHCGMARTKAGLEKGIKLISQLREE